MSLKGRCVLVTRPAHQAGPLCQALEAAGAEAIRLPLIDIQPLPLTPLSDSGDYDWLIFTSPNAVHHGLAGLGVLRSRLAAVGAATARALNQAGHAQVVLPARDYSSEGLLACTELQAVRNQHILLIKGAGGRPLLGEKLSQRGAQVSQRLVYERRAVNPEPALVTNSIQRADSVIATSEQILQRLVDCCPAGQLAKLLNLQLVVPSERVVKRARDLGFDNIVCVSSPLTETALVQALQQLPETSAE